MCRCGLIAGDDPLIVEKVMPTLVRASQVRQGESAVKQLTALMLRTSALNTLAVLCKNNVCLRDCCVID